MAIPCDTIELWSIRLSEHRNELPDCRALLLPDEIERANRFMKPADRNRYILCRATLRRILASELGVLPVDIKFLRNQQGKPYLSQYPLQFNISHSNDRLLIALAHDRALGVDIEFRRDNLQMNAITKRFFSPDEQAVFQTSKNPRATFFDIWSKKEAYVKALGTGIFQDLQSFTVPQENLPEPDIDWAFRTLGIDPAYSAALVWQKCPADRGRPDLIIKPYPPCDVSPSGRMPCP